MNSQEIITQDGEIVTMPVTAEQMSLAIGLSRAEIDQQIATAHAYPRRVSLLTQEILSLVTIDEQSAEECNYALPRGGKPITGPSIRLAEIVAGQWGNCRVGARVVHVDRAEKYVEAEGVFHDLQTNTATTARVRRRISDRQGRLLSDDMIIVTGNAACSIAKRNAILGGVPKAVWRKAHDAALATVKGDIKTLTERREGVLKAFAAFGVKPEQIFASLDVAGLDDITLEHIPVLIGMHAALKSGEATVEEMFGIAGTTGAQASGKKALKERLGDVADGGKQDGAQADKPKQETVNQKQADGNQQTGNVNRKPVEGGEKQGDDNRQGGNVNQQTAGDQSADDDFPGDRPSAQSQKQQAEPSGDDVEAARDRGGEAYHRGMSSKSVPTEYRGNDVLTGAWLGGYDAERDADKEGGDV